MIHYPEQSVEDVNKTSVSVNPFICFFRNMFHSYDRIWGEIA